MVSPFYERLPEALVIDRAKFHICTDFRIWAELECGAAAGDPLSVMLRLMPRIFNPKIPPPSEAVLTQMLWFYGAGRENPPSQHSASAKPPVLDFGLDGRLIWASFRAAYGIDLTIERLHWWKFLALLQALPEDSPLRQIMALRGLDLSEITDTKYRRKMAAAKRRVALPMPKTDLGSMSDLIGAAFAPK